MSRFGDDTHDAGVSYSHQSTTTETTTMVTEKIKELEAARAKLSKLEQAIASERRKELASLPAKYGFSDPAAFIKAVKEATGGRKAAKGKGKEKASGRRPRAVINDETKAKVKALATAGKTGAEIADAVGISIPSVQNIKKELGLTKARKK